MNTSIIESDIFSNFFNSHSERELIDKLDSYISDFGFSNFGYVGLNNRKGRSDCYIYNNHNSEWIERYIENDYVLSDPIFSRSQSTKDPFYWGQETLSDSLTSHQKNIYYEASDFNISNGITIPIHGRAGEFADFSMVFDGSVLEMTKVLKKHKREFILLGNCFHTSLWNVKKKISKKNKNLMPLDIDVLELISQGKSNWEISKKLGLSDQETIFKINEVCNKLGTRSKIHAITKAYCTGLLSNT